ncbi:MAG: sugar transferase [Verrucomicrobiota bacterium]|jgi:exopolysaccharide biosynthesis polyprenyl glycosylphosphotransferase
MNGKSTLMNSEGKERWTPSVAATNKFRWQPTSEFVLTMTLIGDALVIFAALHLGFWVRFVSGLIPVSKSVKIIPIFANYVNLLVMGTAFLLGTFAYLRLYSRHCFLRYTRTARVIVQGTIFWLFAYLAVSLILKFDPPISRAFMLISFVCVLGGMLAWRFLIYKIVSREFFAINLRQRVLFVGWGKEAEQLDMEIRNDYSHPYEIIGYLPSPEGGMLRPPPPSVPVLGDYRDLGTLLEQRCADIVILADLRVKMDEIISLVNLCEMEFAQFKVIPSYFQILASGLRLETISGVPVLGVSELPLDHFSNRLIKRAIDIVGGTVGLLVSLPLLAVFGALVYRESPGPIFYSQKRTGKNGSPFQMYKIRSMRMDAEENGAQWTKENDPRRLQVGTFMRKWNIDEVPQFWNVLKGDMSLVGPRPERPELISRFKHQIPHYHARHTCLPGMTGWAQANGWRGNTSLEERIRYDLWYVENWSAGLDFRIMMLTFLRRKNAY